MIDRHTKIVLTVIAVALSVLAIDATVRSASAQLGGGCAGTSFDPCHIEIDGLPRGLEVTVAGEVDVNITNRELRIEQ